MTIDKANIFKLSTVEFKEYEKDPFLDCFKSTKEFAEALKYDIDTKETPHSLLLSADYGMGKTFFSTRFTQYLKNNKYDVIYFSVWENDYMPNPFLVLSKVLLSYIHNKFKTKKYKNSLKILFETIEKLTETITFTTGVGFNISAKGLIETFKAKTDPIEEFRKQLSDFIKKIPKKKLVLIVDELDRCRPDYAMQTLECIKHFFDIEGLFVIFPTNKEALNDCVKSLYGINNQDRSCKENYFQKFFNDERILKKPTNDDYLHIVNQYITDEKLSEALDKELLTKSEKMYNSTTLLRNEFASFSFKACLTIRELKDFAMELIRICNNFYEPIRVQWLSCLMAYKNRCRNNDLFFRYPLPAEHCFNKERTNSKDSLLTLASYSNDLRYLKRIEYFYNKQNIRIDSQKYHEFICNYRNNTHQTKTYTEAEQFFENLNKDLPDVRNEYMDCEEVIANIDIIEKAALEQHKLILDYQNKYGSDDNDNTRETTYKDVIDNPEILYSLSNN